MKWSSLAVCALAASLAPSGWAVAQEEERYVEVPGEREFTGTMIVRPVQPDAWRQAGLTVVEARARAAAAEGEVARYPLVEFVPQTDEFIVQVPADMNENDVSADLMGTGLFQYAEPNWRVFAIGCPNDPRLGRQWHHNANRMDSCDGWDFQTGRPAIVVGYCDTGIRTGHEDLQQHRREAYNAVDRVWESQGGNIGPVHEHGTWVTGCGSANGDNGIGVAGVGWNLGHRMMRVSNDSSGSASLSVLQHGARTSIESGDRVASVSYSGVDSSSNQSTATYIKSIGGLLVWAAGNDNRNLNGGDRDADDLIVAGGTDENDNKASFSAFGRFVDVAAPATNIETTGSSQNNDYDAVSGTSFACPLTAGLCALIWSNDPSLSPDEVEQLLKQGCDDLGDTGVDNTFGYGRIDVQGSLSLMVLRFSYPNGQPETLELTGGSTVDVVVQPGTANPLPNTGMLHVNDGSGWQALAMAEGNPGEYVGTFPGLTGATCGDEIEWYVSVDADDGGTYTSPFDGMGSPFNAIGDHFRATTTILAEFDFETSPGWSVDNVNLDDGAWSRGVPAGGGDRGDPATDFDGSGRCWLTDNVDGNSDVDGGPTRLVSPAFDLSAETNVTLSYARWFTNDDGDDRFEAEVSADGGGTWARLERLGPFSGWQVASHELADTVSMTSNVVLRFSAADNPNDSVTEAGLDAFRLAVNTCPPMLDLTPNQVGLGDTVVSTTWTGMPNSLTMVFAVDVNGSPIMVRTDLGRLDGEGRRERTFGIPNDAQLVGLDVSLLAYGFDPVGDLFESNTEVLSIR